MKLTPVSREEAQRRGYTATAIFALLQEFINSEHQIVRIDDHNYKAVTTGQAAITQSIKRFGVKGIRCFARKGNLYLEKEL